MVMSLEFDFKNDINLWAIGDFHIGNLGFEEKKLRKVVDMIKKDGKAKVVIMGDLAEFINPRDARFDIECLDKNYDTVEKQYVAIRDILKPIKDKIIGVLMGNHDYRIKKDMGVDFPRFLSTDFNTNYLGNVGILRLNVGKMKYVVLALHGGGLATTIGGQINAIKKYSETLERKPDICLVGHYHRIDVIIDPKLTDTFETIAKYLAITGSFFNTYKDWSDNYANRRFYPPLPVGCVMFELKKDGTIQDHKIIL